MSNVKAVLGRKFSECSRKRANNGGIRGKAKSLNFDFATPKRSSLRRLEENKERTAGRRSISKHLAKKLGA